MILLGLTDAVCVPMPTVLSVIRAKAHSTNLDVSTYSRMHPYLLQSLSVVIVITVLLLCRDFLRYTSSTCTALHHLRQLPAHHAASRPPAVSDNGQDLQGAPAPDSDSRPGARLSETELRVRPGNLQRVPRGVPRRSSGHG